LSALWEEVTLKEITLKIASGSTPTGGKGSYKEEGITLIRSMNVYNFEFLYKDLAYIDDKQAKKLSNVIIEKNDILLNITGASVGRCTIVPNHLLPARINQHIMIIRANPNIVNSNYLLYLLNSIYYKSKLLLLSETGTTREALTKDDISNFKLNLPPLKTQNKIAKILSNYDDLIENNNKQIKLLEEYARVTYEEWFVRLKFPDYENVDVVDGVPEGWEISSINKITSFVNGFAFQSNDFQDSGNSIIKIKNIGNRSIDIFNTDKVLNDITNKLDLKYKVNTGELLIAMTGATVGKLGFMPKDKKKYYINQRVGKIESKYIYYVFLFLNSKKGQQHINNIAMGAAQPNISGEDILSIKSLIPKEKILNIFNKTMKNIYLDILNLQQQNQNLKETRDILLPQLISGKLDVDTL